MNRKYPLFALAFLLVLFFGGGVILGQAIPASNVIEQAVQRVPLNAPPPRVRLADIRINGCCILEVHLPYGGAPAQVWGTTGQSMLPFSGEGNIWVTIPVLKPEEIKVGDIIVFKHPEIAEVLFGHRVVATGSDERGWYAQTQALNPQVGFEPDYWKVRAEHLIGVRVGEF